VLFAMMSQVAEFFDRSVKIAQSIKKDTGAKIKDFRAALKDGGSKYPEIAKLKADVVTFAKQFPTVGF